ncbi:MAG: hypothetical protein P0120_23645 [Nitrospira sp.]|nr:hypothetical protein [Nitrospira sp.]
MRTQISIFLLILFLAMLAPIFIFGLPVSYAQGPNPPPSTQADYSKLGSALLGYLVISAVLEMALTVVFNWRLFSRYLEGKGWKTPFAILFSAFVVWNYDLNMMKDVLDALGMCGKDGCSQSPIIGRVVTAFALAGGSDAFFRLFTRLGIRNPLERKEKAAEEAAA